MAHRVLRDSRKRPQANLISWLLTLRPSERCRDAGIGMALAVTTRATQSGNPINWEERTTLRGRANEDSPGSFGHYLAQGNRVQVSTARNLMVPRTDAGDRRWHRIL